MTKIPGWGTAAIGNCPLTPAGTIAILCATLLSQWIKIAWNDSSPESTTNWIIKCCLSKDMNEIDVHVLQEEAHEDKKSSSNENIDSDNGTMMFL